MYSIEFKKSAVKELEKLPKEIIEAITKYPNSKQRGLHIYFNPSNSW